MPNNVNIIKVGECYICTLENGFVSPCKCKNLFLHPECELKLIKTSNNMNCSVCKYPYDNIKIVKKYKYKLSRHCKIVICFYLISLVLLSCGGYFFTLFMIDFYRNRNNVIILIIVNGTFIVIGLIIFISATLYLLYNNCSQLIKITTILEPTIITKSKSLLKKTIFINNNDIDEEQIIE